MRHAVPAADSASHSQIPAGKCAPLPAGMDALAGSHTGSTGRAGGQVSEGKVAEGADGATDGKAANIGEDGFTTGVRMNRNEIWENVARCVPQTTEILRLARVEDRSWVVLSGANGIKVRDGGLGYYRELLRQGSELDDKIQLDANRTFHSRELSELLGPKLFRILHAFSLHNPRIGYCQGLNFIAGLLLREVVDEHDTFCVLVALMENFGLGDLYQTDEDHLSLLLARFSCILEQELPELFLHLISNNFPLFPHAVEWFTTLFAGVFTTEEEPSCEDGFVVPVDIDSSDDMFTASCIVDLLFEGVDDLFILTGVSIFRILKNELMKCSAQQVILSFKSMVREKVDAVSLLSALLIEIETRGNNGTGFTKSTNGAEVLKRYFQDARRFLPVRNTTEGQEFRLRCDSFTSSPSIFSSPNSHGPLGIYGGGLLSVVVPRGDMTRGNFVCYVVVVTMVDREGHMSSWMIRKRFSSIVEMHETLQQISPSISLPELPRKGWLGNKGTKFIQERKVALQDYFDQLLQVPGMRECPELVRFLSYADPTIGKAIDAKSRNHTLGMFWKLAEKYGWGEEEMSDILSWTQAPWFIASDLEVLPMSVIGTIRK
mmetsp:Transcript_19445/g.31994  ORF Transcript_19445/g.31994 Transcript_19445/m.31994 type:complete len:603 (+) Transcript_19445:64-1872(+)